MCRTIRSTADKERAKNKNGGFIFEKRKEAVLLGRAKIRNLKYAPSYIVKIKMGLLQRIFRFASPHFHFIPKSCFVRGTFILRSAYRYLSTHRFFLSSAEISSKSTYSKSTLNSPSFSKITVMMFHASL